jgi:hypothetical protein
MDGQVLISDRGSAQTITLPSTSTTEIGFQITIIHKTVKSASPMPQGFTIASEADTDVLYGGIWGASSDDGTPADFFGNNSDDNIIVAGTAAGAGSWFEFTLVAVNKWVVIGTTITDGTPADPFA